MDLQPAGLYAFPAVDAARPAEEIYSDELCVVADAVKANEYREKVSLMRAALRKQL